MSIGPWQIILILLVLVLLFGAGKIPRLMGDMAKGVKEFKKGMKDEEVESAASKEAAPKTLESESGEKPVASEEKDKAS